MSKFDALLKAGARCARTSALLEARAEDSAKRGQKRMHIDQVDVLDLASIVGKQERALRAVGEVLLLETTPHRLEFREKLLMALEGAL